MRGTLTEKGTNSPWRDRPAQESLTLLREMRDGKHPDGSMALRAKINMGSPNINMRDPVMYRIRHVAHHRTGSDWCIYRSEEHTSELQSLMRISYAVFCLKKKK